MNFSATLTAIRRPNWIEIDLDALEHNIQYVRSLIPAHCKILLPVKADAYGHGSLACSYAALRAGVDWLGVAHLFEAVLLRQYGIRSPILVLGTVTPEDFPFIQAYRITPSFADLSIARAYADWLRANHLRAAVHLKIDTGMHRFGIAPDDWQAVVELARHPHIDLEGFFSHLATADIPNHPATQRQIRTFMSFKERLEQNGVLSKMYHLSNSAGLLSRISPDLDMVRPGIALYGYNPIGNMPHPRLRPVLRIKATVRQIRTIPAGESVSYGLLWTASRPTRVATVAIGYGDGYLRGEPNQGVFFVRGRPCPILGRICMDATMIDVSHIEDLSVGDPVDVIHGEQDPAISLEAIAERNHTIAYEIATRVARRLYRLYTYRGQVMRWDELKTLLGIPEFEEYPADLFKNAETAL